MSGNTHTLTRGNKHYELCNHLGNVLVTVQDRKQSKDVNADDMTDYYLAYLRTVTDYYAFGSAMEGLGGTVPECTVTQTQTTQTVYDVNEDFNSGGTGGFTAGSGARTVSNPLGTELHLEAIWTTRPLAEKTLSLVNGRAYTLNFDLVDFSVVSGYTHTVKVRILLPGNTLTYTYTATGAQAISFTSSTTGNVTLEISSQITGSGSYGINPYVDVDNVQLSWQQVQTTSVNNCTGVQGYRYGFNNQEKDNEVYGEGNSTTAEFWQYDARLGRRWNVDPRFNPSLSYYVCFANNPIYITDPNGDTTYIYNSKGQYVFNINDKLSTNEIVFLNDGIAKAMSEVVAKGVDQNTADFYARLSRGQELWYGKSPWFVLGRITQKTMNDLNKYYTNSSSENSGLLYSDPTTKEFSVWECEACKIKSPNLAYGGESNPSGLDASNEIPKGAFYIYWHTHPDKGDYNSTEPSYPNDFSNLNGVMGNYFQNGGTALIVTKSAITIYPLYNNGHNVNESGWTLPFVTGANTSQGKPKFAANAPKNTKDKFENKTSFIRFYQKYLRPKTLWLK